MKPRLISKYFLSQAVFASFGVLLVLLAISGFVNTVAQTDDIGKGDYGWADALYYVLLSLPGTAYDMFPMGALLGGLLAYGQMARQSELVAMQAAGITMNQLAKAALGVGVVLALCVLILGEWVAAPAGRLAKHHRATAKQQGLQWAGDQGGWLRDGDRFVHIDDLASVERASGVTIYTLDPENWTLKGLSSANRATLSEQQQWQLRNVKATELGEQRVKVERFDSVSENTALGSDILSLASVEPTHLNMMALSRYARYLKDNGQNMREYSQAFWTRLASPLTVLLMAVLALPFVFGSLRDRGFGSRLMLGVLVGVGYFLGQKTLLNLGSTIGLNAALTAFLPVLVLLAVTTYFIRRMRFQR